MYSNSNSNGGNAVVRRYGKSWMRKIGRRGGNAVVEKYGTNYMSLLAESGSPNISNRRLRKVLSKIDTILASGQE